MEVVFKTRVRFILKSKLQHQHLSLHFGSSICHCPIPLSFFFFGDL